MHIVSNLSVVRIAPQRNAQQVTNAWRIFTQGNEFYAAPRNSAQIGKVSFHKNLNWQYRLGTVSHRLARPIALTEGWLHALEISFLIDQHVFLPLEQRENKVTLIETPANYKLLVNLLLSQGVRRVSLKPPPEIIGSILGFQRLRSGATLLITSRILPISDADRALISEVRHKLNVNFTKHPSEGVYIEMSWMSFDPKAGNVIAIIPTGYETISIQRS